MPTDAPVRGVRRIDLLSDDPSASVRFWGELLGWVVLPVQAGRLDCWVGERQVATCRRPGPAEPLGWRVVFGGAAGGVLAGPDGVSAACDAGRVQHGPTAPTPRPGEPCWVELVTEGETGARAADDYWPSRCGWTVAPAAPDVPAGTAALYRSGDWAVAGRRVPDPELGSERAGWACYFAVTDVAEATRRCQERGGAVLRAPGATLAGQVGVVRDPAGVVGHLLHQPAGWGGAWHSPSSSCAAAPCHPPNFTAE
ncbi:hypothetical protein GCM10012275_56880 [Longimycelium tulufanense]|uniref:Glyoxalase-like domain-containing protein n=1 Tax=Longimycelium tulufanense TaxID=907463 RepID=A0A8J3CJW7_9PSEU|nr:VOC family protein [Longimycelium tulufanense]GGM78869.1 hypothetical protein GCM10012275_56880 [Longimycelium tulufanense]